MVSSHLPSHFSKAEREKKKVTTIYPEKYSKHLRKDEKEHLNLLSQKLLYKWPGAGEEGEDLV